MCLIETVRYSWCPVSHSTSRVVLQHDQAIYCGDQRVNELQVIGRCFECHEKLIEVGLIQRTGPEKRFDEKASEKERQRKDSGKECSLGSHLRGVCDS